MRWSSLASRPRSLATRLFSTSRPETSLFSDAAGTLAGPAARIALQQPLFIQSGNTANHRHCQSPSLPVTITTTERHCLAPSLPCTITTTRCAHPATSICQSPPDTSHRSCIHPKHSISALPSAPVDRLLLHGTFRTQ